MPTQNLHYAIGIDLGGSKIELGIVDETGYVHHHQRLETLTKEGPQAVENQILESIYSLQQQAKGPIMGVGIGVAGQIHPQTGLVIFAPNLKWHHFPLQSNIEKRLKLPVRIMNDVRAITWGEWMYGAGKGCHDLLCVFIGTGIGSGIVSGGKFLMGDSNTCGEVGHMTIDFEGPVCTCGKRGCLEAFAGGWGIAARAREAIQADSQGNVGQLMLKLSNDQLDRLTTKVVVEAYYQGDPLARQLIEQVKRVLIAGFASLINVFNPRRLILGGGFIDGMPEMIEVIDKGIRENALKAATQSLEVVKAKLGKQTGVIGSAAAIFNILKLEGKSI